MFTLLFAAINTSSAAIGTDIEGVEEEKVVGRIVGGGFTVGREVFLVKK
jgi:hypothetical protein